jgi:dihydrolipoamide dehydrogenase
VVERSRKVAKQLSNGVAFLLKKHKVTVIDGEGALLGKGKLSVSKGGKPIGEYQAKHIIIATGARARSLPGLEPDGKLVWTYKEAMIPEKMPKSLLVVGSGAIGIEFASFYRDMGAEVTVVEVLDRVLPVEDEEISAFAKKAFEKQGMKIFTSTQVKELKKNADSVVATLVQGDKSQQLEVERVILAIGIVGNVENMGLEKTKVKIDRTHIVINEWCQTGEPGMYAIGDVVGAPWLAHKAMHEGVMCVEHIAGLNNVHPLNVNNIPGCTYCRPQVASVGLTEAAAKEAGHEIKVGKQKLGGVGGATVYDDKDGLVKLVVDSKYGEILGAHIVGNRACDMIAELIATMALEGGYQELAQIVHPHPTISEAIPEAARAVAGGAIHA